MAVAHTVQPGSPVTGAYPYRAAHALVAKRGCVTPFSGFPGGAPLACDAMNAKTNPVLLCFDGSSDAENAISSSAQLLGPVPAIVIAVSEPVRLWEPSDPATILEAPIGKLLSKALELEEIGDEVAQEHVNRGVELARTAGFDASGRLVRGKAWRAICDVAREIDTAAIVLGARGLSRVESALLGSVSAAVSVHAEQPVLIIHPHVASGGRRH